jgi:hypothetical protein
MWRRLEVCQKSCRPPCRGMSNNPNQPLPPNDNDPSAKQKGCLPTRVPRMKNGTAFFMVGYLGNGVYAVFAAGAQGRKYKLFVGSSISEVRAYLNGVQRPGDGIMMSDALQMLEMLERPTVELRPGECEPWQAPFLPTCELETVAGVAPSDGAVEHTKPEVEGAETPAEEAPAPGQPSTAEQAIFMIDQRLHSTNRLSGIIDLTVGAEPTPQGDDPCDPPNGGANSSPSNN